MFTLTTPPWPFSLPGFRLGAIRFAGSTAVVEASSLQQSVPCPRCGSIAARIHSRYLRSPRDVPSGTYAVQLKLHVRRFFCHNPACRQHTFAERLPDLLPVHAQRTTRLTAALQVLGFALGGAAGARAGARLRFPASRDTLLRIVRSAPWPVSATPRVLGSDDFALRKGRRYGTIFVDLERHCPVDLVPDRTATTVEHWLRAHPGVHTIARDRSNAYARGATLGAPAARQVADRWHLLRNLRDALERVLTRRRAHRRRLLDPHAAAPISDITAAAPARPRRLRPPSASERLHQQESRTRRYQRYVLVHELLVNGLSQRRIAQLLGMSRVTIRAFALAETLPARSVRYPAPSQLDPYIAYLQQRWNAGCHHAMQLWREIQRQGYACGRGQVARWAQQRRTVPAPTSSKVHQAPTDPPGLVQSSGDAEGLSPVQLRGQPRQLVWLVLRRTDDLTATDQAQLAYLLRDPYVREAHALAQDVRNRLPARDAPALTAWLEACARSRLVDLQSFAASLRHEHDAVYAAVREEWSTGQVEGQNTRVKLLKRQMYGRANFDLLRRRVLYRDCH